MRYRKKAERPCERNVLEKEVTLRGQVFRENVIILYKRNNKITALFKNILRSLIFTSLHNSVYITLPTSSTPFFDQCHFSISCRRQSYTLHYFAQHLDAAQKCRLHLWPRSRTSLPAPFCQLLINLLCREKEKSSKRTVERTSNRLHPHTQSWAENGGRRRAAPKQWQWRRCRHFVNQTSFKCRAEQSRAELGATAARQQPPGSNSTQNIHEHNRLINKLQPKRNAVVVC